MKKITILLLIFIACYCQAQELKVTVGQIIPKYQESYDIIGQIGNSVYAWSRFVPEFSGMIRHKLVALDPSTMAIQREYELESFKVPYENKSYKFYGAMGPKVFILDNQIYMIFVAKQGMVKIECFITKLSTDAKPIGTPQYVGKGFRVSKNPSGKYFLLAVYPYFIYDKEHEYTSLYKYPKSVFSNQPKVEAEFKVMDSDLKIVNELKISDTNWDQEILEFKSDLDGNIHLLVAHKSKDKSAAFEIYTKSKLDVDLYKTKVVPETIDNVETTISSNISFHINSEGDVCFGGIFLLPEKNSKDLFLAGSFLIKIDGQSHLVTTNIFNLFDQKKFEAVLGDINSAQTRYNSENFRLNYIYFDDHDNLVVSGEFTNKNYRANGPLTGAILLSITDTEGKLLWEKLVLKRHQNDNTFAENPYFDTYQLFSKNKQYYILYPEHPKNIEKRPSNMEETERLTNGAKAQLVYLTINEKGEMSDLIQINPPTLKKKEDIANRFSYQYTARGANTQSMNISPVYERIKINTGTYYYAIGLGLKDQHKVDRHFFKVTIE